MAPEFKIQILPTWQQQVMSDQPPVAGLSNFDEVPIGHSPSTFAIDQYQHSQLQGSAPQSQHLSLEQKLASKVVKIKLQGLEELKKSLEEGGEVEPELLSKILKQNNPACMERALQCAQKWLEAGRQLRGPELKEVIENGWVNGRGNSKNLALGLIYRVFQVRADEVEGCLVEAGLKNKVPKLIGGYISVLNELLQEFGIKQLKYLKPYLGHIVKILNTEKLPAVKSEGMLLLKGGLKWVSKDFVWPLIGELKDNMKKQLQTFWEEWDKQTMMRANRQKHAVEPTRNQGKKEPKQQMGGNEGADQTQGESINLYQISDPVDVFGKFDEKWSDSVLQAEKWNIKVSLMQELIAKASVPKIASTQSRHITEMIRRLINDSNFNVVLTVLKLASTMAKGLRRNFTHAAKILFPYILPKFRDKKTQMIEETFKTLDSFYHCLSLEEVSEDVKLGLKDKSAEMKKNTVKWMLSHLERREQEQSQISSLERLAEYFKSGSMQALLEGLISDSNGEVRDNTVKLVCKIKGMFGDAILKNIDKNISSKQILSKINDGLEAEKSLSKSRSKVVAEGRSESKIKSSSKAKKKVQQDQEQQSINAKSYVIRRNSDGKNTIDITEELNKIMKKLNDSSNWNNRKQSAERLLKYLQGVRMQNPQCKIVSPSLNDLLSVIRQRIFDPNKQLVKVFISLTAETFCLLSEKQAKMNAKLFMQELIHVFSDKNEANKKQVHAALNRICETTGPDFVLYMGQILSQQSQSSSNNGTQGSYIKQLTLQYLMNCEYFLSRVEAIEGEQLRQLREYPKLILSGLCDKNKDLRAVSEKMLKLLSEKTGTAIFRSLIKDQKSVYKSDLNTLIDKYETEQQSIISNGSFVSLTQVKEGELRRNRSPSVHEPSRSAKPEKTGEKSKRKVSNAGSLASSRSQNKLSSLMYDQNAKEQCSNLSFVLKNETAAHKTITGEQMFASLQTLTSQRVAREENSNRYRHSCDSFMTEQAQIQSQLSRLVNHEQLYLKMYSSDYRKNLEAGTRLMRLCRDISEAGAVRQLQDLLLKWVGVKLHGGNVACMGLVELLCPVLSVLEKKKIAWTDYDIDVMLAVLKQYLFACFVEGAGVGQQNLELIRNVFKLATLLSSGERTLKKILIELKNAQNAQLHRHLTSIRRQGLSCGAFMKKMYVKICCALIDYFSNHEILGEAATIEQLRVDDEFVGLLSSRFHAGVLGQFGFVQQQQQGAVNLGAYDSRQMRSQSKHEMRSISPAPNNLTGTSRNARKLELSHGKTPSKHTDPHLPPPSPMHKPLASQLTHKPTGLSQTYLPQPPKRAPTLQSLYSSLSLPAPEHSYQINCSAFPQPSPHNPLGANLLKLYPYNETTVHFFSTLLQPQNHNSEKISQELSANCDIIYGSMFNALVRIMDPSMRETHNPERITIFLSLMQQAIKCKNLFRHVRDELVDKSIRYTVDQLVYEDENKAIIEAKLRSKGFAQFKGETFIKGINGVMLRLLDNSMPLLLLNVLLLNVVETYHQLKTGEQPKSAALPLTNRSKKLVLLIRCFSRAAGNYFGQSAAGHGGKDKEKDALAYNIEQDASCIRMQHVQNFLILVREYLQLIEVYDIAEFENNQASKTISSNSEDNIVGPITKILRNLHRKKLILRNLQQVKAEVPFMKEERSISSYVQQISQEQLSSHTKSHNILGQNNTEYNMQGTTYPALDQQLKRIIQLLSKSKTFSEGVKQLKLYLQQTNPKFDYRTHFTRLNFEQGFIDRVQAELSQYKTGAQGQPHARSLNPDIQGKLDKLKMKLEGINSEHASAVIGKNLDKLTIERGETGRSREVSVRDRSVEKSLGGQQGDLKRRIEEMKNKVTMSTTNRIR